MSTATDARAGQGWSPRWRPGRLGVVSLASSVRSLGPTNAVALLVVAVAIGCRAVMLTRESFWTDELWSIDAAGMDFKSMFGARLRGEQNPPLYYLTLWVWLRLTRSVAELPVRSLSLIFSVVTIAALWRLGARLGNRVIGVVASLLMAVSGIGIHFSLEARGYGMSMMFVALSLHPWVAVMQRRDGVTRNAFFFALFGALGGFAHYYGNLVYGLLVITLLAYLMLARRFDHALRAVGWVGVSLVPLLTWLVFTRSRLSSGGLPPSSIQTLWDASSTLIEPLPTAIVQAGSVVSLPTWLLERRSETGVLGLAALLVLTCVLVAQLVFAALRKRSPEVREAALGLIGMIIVGAAVLIAYQSSQMWKPTLSVRNLIVLLPLIFLASGCAVAGASRRRGDLRVLALSLVSLLVLALAMPSWANAGTRGTGRASAEFVPAARFLLREGAATGGKNLVGLQPPYDWTGDWLAASSAVTAQAPPLRFAAGMAGVHWTMDPQGLPDVSTLPDGPIVAFGFDNWDAARLKTFIDLAVTKYGHCTTIPFDHVGVVRCRG